ncbi:MAG: ubiquinol-cytochrome C chaperone family protein [Caulobacteraceae bacterium]
MRLRGRLRHSAGRTLCDSAVRQARAEALYAVMGAPDTIEGRFEVLTLHVILLIEALRTGGETAAATRQALFDAYLSDLDGALREMGVGDLSVGKRMRELGKAFYGRAAAYRKALESLPDRTDLERLIGRTILADSPGPSPDALADYVVRCHQALHAGPDLLRSEPNWAAP